MSTNLSKIENIFQKKENQQKFSFYYTISKISNNFDTYKYKNRNEN
jgi:hypothetical protein